MRTWFANFDDADAPRVYLLRVSYEGTVQGWQHADMSGVVDMLSQVAWDDAHGDGGTTVTVHLVTELGILPCDVVQTACPGIDMVCVEVFYRDPLKRGRAARTLADKAFRKTVEG